MKHICKGCKNEFTKNYNWTTQYYCNKNCFKKHYYKNYYQENKEKFKGYVKKWQKNNQDKIKAYRKEYHQRPKVKEKHRKHTMDLYYRSLERRKYLVEWQRKYRNGGEPEKTRLKRLATAKRWRELNREKLRENERKRKLTDPQFAIKKRLMGYFSIAISRYSTTGKIMSSKKYGVDYKAIIEHLKPFPQDIKNYEIDHIMPLSKFDLTDPKQVTIAFAPENHQWLTMQENRKKRDKIIIFL